MTQDPKTRPQSDDDVWLEQALVLAASELSAFRTSAQGERDRLQRESDSVRARVQVLEEQLQEAEQRHAVEIAESRALLDVQLNDRAKAWAEFSRELKQRITSISGVKLQHQLDLEEAASLRKQVHDLRLSLEAAQGTHAEIETRLAASEESYAVAAETMQRAREEAAEAITQRETLRVELSASAGHCAELQTNRQIQARKLEELESARAEIEKRLEATRAELVAERERAAGLEPLEKDAERLRLALEDALTAHTALGDELGRVREQLAEASRATEHALAAAAREKAEAEAAQKRARDAHDDVISARRERDETTTQLATKTAELESSASALDRLRRELEEQSTRDAMLDLEKQRNGKLKNELDAIRVELEPLRQERERIARELNGANDERERVASALREVSSERDKHAAELDAVHRERERAAGELQLLQAEHARQTIELQQALSDRSRLAAELASIQSATPRPRSPRGDGSDTRDHQTMPLPDMAPANRDVSQPPPPPPPAAARREGTAYSYNEVAEEQVFVPARSPARGGSGGRGSR